MFETSPETILHCGACGSPQRTCHCHKIAVMTRCPDTGRMRSTVPVRQMLQQQHVGVLISPKSATEASISEEGEAVSSL